MFVEVNKARLFFDVAGPKLALTEDGTTERPSLLVLHGGPGFDHMGLRPYFDRFADTHQVIYLDHRANGRSQGDLADCTLAQWGEDIAGFCAALGIEKPVVLGQSFGGMVAMSYAARHPDGPAKLILSSTAARLNMAETLAAMERLGGAKARAIAEAFWADPTDEGAAAYSETCLPLYNPGPARDGSDRRRATMRTDTLIHFVKGEQQTMDLLPGLAHVRCPTLVLSGALDPITPPSCAQAIYDALPQAHSELRLFAEAGHGVFRDLPDEAETVLRGFLAS